MDRRCSRLLSHKTHPTFSRPPHFSFSHPSAAGPHTTQHRRRPEASSPSLMLPPHSRLDGRQLRAGFSSLARRRLAAAPSPPRPPPCPPRQPTDPEIPTATQKMDKDGNAGAPADADPEVHEAPSHALPSARARRRWRLSKAVHAGLDALQQRAAAAGQRLNEYTGTDYAGIAALRREIAEQEQLVAARRTAVAAARAAVDAAAAARAAAQREVVALLERKPAWTAADLERYMARLREGHAQELRERETRAALEAAERRLDAARRRLDDRVRARYHEEQVWSDTIRRNATWWTVGLMGVNIAVLLGNLVVVEPWRRRRLVGEIRAVMDARLPSPEPVRESAVLETGAAVDGQSVAAEGSESVLEADEGSGQVDLSSAEAAIVLGGTRTIRSLDDVKDYIYGFFDQETMLLRRVDLTTIAVQSGLLGAAVTAGAFLLIVRQR